MDDIDRLEQEGRSALAQATTSEELELARVAVLGRSAPVTLALRGVATLEPSERGPRGRGAERRAQAARGRACRARRCALVRRAGAAPARGRDRRDACPACAMPRGVAHLLSQTQRAIEDVFVGLGYRIAEGPEVELEYYNFTALNTPDDHPAKAESDTLWVDARRRACAPTPRPSRCGRWSRSRLRLRDRAGPRLPPRRARRDPLAAVPADRGHRRRPRPDARRPQGHAAALRARALRPRARGR